MHACGLILKIEPATGRISERHHSGELDRIARAQTLQIVNGRRMFACHARPHERKRGRERNGNERDRDTGVPPARGQERKRMTFQRSASGGTSVAPSVLNTGAESLALFIRCKNLLRDAGHSSRT